MNYKVIVKLICRVHPCESGQDTCSKAPATVACVECGVKLCGPCNDKVHKTGRFKTHQRNDLAPPPIMCDAHDGVPAIAYCKACGGVNLCAPCDTARHQEHVREAPKAARPSPSPAAAAATAAATVVAAGSTIDY